MRRRTARDLVTIVGVLVVIAGMVAFKSFTMRSDLAARMDGMRRSMEQMRGEAGVQLLSWDLVRTTKGTMRSGPTFDKKMLEHRDSIINLIGFMVPLYEFRDAKEFLLLPLPIECYFCQMPPMRDVMFVQMGGAELAKIVNEPVLISGQLTLNEGAGTKFFYVIKEAKWGAADPKATKASLTQKQTAPEHTAPAHLKQMGDDGKMLEGSEPPKLDPGAAPPETGGKASDAGNAPNESKGTEETSVVSSSGTQESPPTGSEKAQE